MSEPALPTTGLIQLTLDGPVATVTLNRPERLNAAPPQMFDELRATCEALPAHGARVVIITGAGRAFCSGADVVGMAQASGASAGTSRSAGTWEALTRHYNPAMLALARLPIPVITAVNGPAAGIGCSLALAGDFVIAAQSAYFLEAFVNIGLVPDGGATWMLPRLVGKARAMQMIMLGERIGAAQAADWGMVYKVVDDAQLMAEARALAARLAQGPTRALGLMRQGLARALEQSYAEGLATEAAHQSQAVATQDAAEGARAFVERRPTRFTGQ
jgi:2-(1,2-epoxy-1,2-dihydrophenyl)acetyl-CoA isomerase